MNFDGFVEYMVDENSTSRDFNNLSDDSPIVIVNSGQLDDKSIITIKKIIQSIQLELKENNIIYLNEEHLNMNQLLTSLESSPQLFLFGVQAKQLNLQSNLMLNRNYRYEDFSIFCTWELTQLVDNIAYKKELWQKLKQYFGS